ncbi:hypothetical protein [Succinimonas sp.]|uniref:hypothetical protein n=1 Tax=Succinimonas sp. TaxID=1936151 RepID=UPI00386E2163
MKDFEWIPNKRIGDLCFNMTRNETRNAMGDAVFTPWFEGRSDVYKDYSMRLDFDEDGLLESVEFLGIERGFFQVWYNERIIYPKTEKTFFKIFDKSMFKLDDESMYQCNKLNIRANWNYDIGPTLLVGREHYIDEGDESLKDFSILYGLSSKLKPGMHRNETRIILHEKSDKLKIRGQNDIYGRYFYVKFDNEDRMISADFII